MSNGTIVYKMRQGYKSPSDPDIKIWRYIDFTKFISMIHGSRLHFARLDSLGDPFEGAAPRKVLEGLLDAMDWEAIEAGGTIPTSSVKRSRRVCFLRHGSWPTSIAGT